MKFPWSRRLRVIQQMEAAECGVASLAMILDYHGASIPLDELRDICGTSRDGNTALQLLTAASSLGLDGEGLRLSLDDLERAKRPLILHWGMMHFLVLERFDGKRATLLDPALGRLQLDREELSRRYTGVALDLVPTPRLRKRKRSSPGLSQYFKNLNGARAMVVFVVAAGATSQLLGVFAPALQQLLIDEVIRPLRSSWLVPVLGVVLAISVVALVLQWLYRATMVRLQTALAGALTEQMGAHLLRLPLNFVESRNRGDLLQRVQSHAGLGELLTQTVLGSFHLLFAFGLAALMMCYEPTLGLATLGVDLARVLLVRSLRRESRERSAGEIAARGQETSIVVQAASAGEVVRAFGIQEKLRSWYERRLKERLRWTRLSARLESGAASGLLLFDAAAQALVVWLGGVKVIDAQMTIGVFAGFMTIRTLLAEPLASLLAVAESWIDFRSVLTRTDEILKRQKDEHGSTDARRLAPTIELRNVGFRHGSGSAWLFRGVSLKVEAGQRVALVGPSGQGKSTLLRLMCGVLSPTEGEVLLGGVPLRDCSAESLAAKLGVVVGPPVVKHATVLENLRLRLPDASDDAAYDAAEMACFAEVVARLPGGYEATLDTKASCLSGGERQRLGVAQALVARPDLLLLDEATCHLDPSTENRLIENVCSAGTTLVSVAHRPAFVQASDAVYRVQHGRVVREASQFSLERAPLPDCRTVEANFTA
ncbi:MAG: hypothetical protein RL033_5788 [Pseudomonadota bacterium]